MRLALIRRRFNPYGGAEGFIVSAARQLIAEGVEVSVITEDFEGAALPGLTEIRVPKVGWTRGTRNRSFQAGVAKAVAGGRFDLVQSHERLLTADLFRAGDGVHAAWLDRLARERAAWRRPFLRLDPLHRLVMATERRMARETEMRFIANSTLVARELRDWLGLPESRILTLENGVDLDRFRPATPEEHSAARSTLGLPDDAPVIAYVGSGFERKGAFHLVRALALPESRGIHLILAGRDRGEKALAELAARLDVAARVHILGGIRDVRPILAAADGFALPSLYDPMPNAALEALAAGLPVLTTADTGIAEAITTSGAGLVVPREPEAIAAGLARMTAPDHTMRSAALALRPRYDIKAATKRWMALYRHELGLADPADPTTSRGPA